MNTLKLLQIGLLVLGTGSLLQAMLASEQMTQEEANIVLQNQRDNDFVTAIEGGHLDQVRQLIAGVNVNDIRPGALNPRRRIANVINPLITAWRSRKPKRLRIMQELLRADANPAALNDMLVDAANEHNFDTVRWLLAHGAQHPEAVSNMDTVRWLLAHGAQNPDTGSNMDTVLWFCAYYAQNREVSFAGSSYHNC